MAPLTFHIPALRDFMPNELSDLSMNAQPSTERWCANDAIVSAQVDVHEDLIPTLKRRTGAVFLKPIAPYNQSAFDGFMQAWAKSDFAPLIVDAGCGVGESTLHIARAHPQAFVVGVDQSQDRIETRKSWWCEEMPANFIWVRADLVDFWRLLGEVLAQRGEQLFKHFILYPNPWPKIGHLQRRWHAHPIFPQVLALGGALECRSNWGIYVREFDDAVRFLAGIEAVVCAPFVPDAPITPFERKYHTRGEPLFVCRHTLPELPL